MASTLIRCFVAIELPAAVKAELSALQQQFKAARMDFARWVNPESIHLTLKFLGEVPQERVPEMVKAIEEAVDGIKPFSLELNGLGVFPNARQPRVFWVGVGGDLERLKTLQGNADVTLGALGFEEEQREFTAHLTLARMRDDAAPDQKRAFGELVGRTSFESRHRFTVHGVNLMRSQLKPTGAVYTALAVVPFKP